MASNVQGSYRERTKEVQGAHLIANRNREHYNMHLRIFRNTLQRVDVWGGGNSAKPQRGVRYTVLHLEMASNGVLFILHIRILKSIQIQFKN
jgi:hypothetical protein